MRRPENPFSPQRNSCNATPKTGMRYDHEWENLDQSAVNFLGYEEE